MNNELSAIKEMFLSSLREFGNKHPCEEIFTIFISCEPVWGSAFIHIDTNGNSSEKIEWLKNKNHSDWIGSDKNGYFNNNGFDSKYAAFKECIFENWKNPYWNEADEREEELERIYSGEDECNSYKYHVKNAEGFFAKYLVNDYHGNEIEILILDDDDEYNKYYFEMIKILINNIIEETVFGKFDNLENNFRIILEMLDSEYMEIWNINLC